RVLFEQLMQQLSIEIGRINFLQRLVIALFPMAEQVGVELARPTDATFKKAEFQGGKSPRHAAEKQRLANRLPRTGEVANMVVGEIGGRHTQAEAAAGAMESRRET